MHEFCSGYDREPFRSLVADYPGADVYPAKDFRTEWGPIFHRGRLDGTARVLVLGQDPATHESIVRRILVGEAGQRVQGLLARLGITTCYVMINTFLYGVYRESGGAWHAHDPKIAAYRHRWLTALLAPDTGEPPITAVITLGLLAKIAYQDWAQAQPDPASRLHLASIKHPTYPESASASGAITLEAATRVLLDDWNAHLPDLRTHIEPDTPVPERAYGDRWQDGDLAPIPQADMPAGSPPWWTSSHAWAQRTGPTAQLKRSTITVTIPEQHRAWPPVGPSLPVVAVSGTVAVTGRHAPDNPNPVIDRDQPFDVDVGWQLSGDLVPQWLETLSAQAENWVVTAYAQSQSRGEQVRLGSVEVPVRGPLLSQDEAYTAKLTVPAHTLERLAPIDPARPSTYQIKATMSLDSNLGPMDDEISGYAEGPTIQVEDRSGTYRVLVTTFLDSDLGPVGYDMMGYAEGPTIEVEGPEVVGSSEADSVGLDTPEERLVSVWLAEADQITLTVGVIYHLGVRIGSVHPDSLVSSPMPHMRQTKPLDIIVAVHGHDVEVRPAWQKTTLPVTGDTEDLIYEIQPVVDGPVGVTVSVHLARSLARIDELDVALVATAMQEANK